MTLSKIMLIRIMYQNHAHQNANLLINAKQNDAKQNDAKQNDTQQNNALQNNAKQNDAHQNYTEQNMHISILLK